MVPLSIVVSQTHAELVLDRACVNHKDIRMVAVLGILFNRFLLVRGTILILLVIHLLSAIVQ